jgi:hypothetical protein
MRMNILVDPCFLNGIKFNHPPDIALGQSLAQGLPAKHHEKKFPGRGGSNRIPCGESFKVERRKMEDPILLPFALSDISFPGFPVDIAGPKIQAFRNTKSGIGHDRDHAEIP